jgi:hypothetical protein
VTADLSRATALRLALTLVASLTLTLSACKGGDAASGKRGAGADAKAGDRYVEESAGDVVIASPSARYTVAPVSSPGSVSGVVSFSSPVTPAAPVATGADSATCGVSLPDESVQVKGNAVASAVVWLDGVRTGKPLPVDRRMELESDQCRLKPRVQAMVVGSAVNLIAHDAFRTHLRFIAGGESKPRATALLGGDEQVIPTDLPARTPGMVIVRDSARAWPRAFLAVFDHPYYAVTGADGSFTIDGVPPGTYTLHVWHERAKPAEQKVTVGAGGAVKANVALTASPAR